VRLSEYYKWGFFANFELGTFLNKSITEQSAFFKRLLYQVNELWEMEIETVRKATVISGSKRLIALAINLVLMTTMASRFNSPEYGTQKAIDGKRRHMHHGIYGISIKPSTILCIA
jgi:hypothetical protein